MPEPTIFRDIAPLVDAGFAVHWLHPRQKRPYGNDWSTRPVATLEKLRSTYRKDNNVGVRLGRYSQVAGLYLHVLDIDIRDADVVEEAFERLETLFPGVDLDSLPMVRSGSGGASRHLYLLTDRPFASKKLAHSVSFFVDDAGKKHWDWEIELFGTGKQVAAPPSIHPDSGRPYEWVREFDWEMLEMGVAPEFPADLLASKTQVDVREEALAADDEDGLLALARTSMPLGLTEDACRDILKLLPKDDWCDDRDGWLKVGMALHHEFEGADEGFDLWCEFSQESDKFDEADQRRVWDSFRPSKTDPITMGFFRKLAAEDGLEFDAACEAIRQTSGYRASLSEAAKYELMAWEQDVVLGILAEKAKLDNLDITKPSLRKSLVAERRAYVKRTQDAASLRLSIESWLAEEVLRVFYAGGERLVVVAGTPWSFRKGVWSITDKETIHHQSLRVIQKVFQGGRGAPEALVEAVRDSDRTDFLNALTGNVASLVQKLRTEDSSTDPLGLRRRYPESVVNCMNGEVWFEDGTYELRQHDPDNRFTHQAAVMYDEDAECPQWDEALERIFRDCDDPEGMIRHLHEVMGYLIQSNRDHALWVLFYGVGANGKSFVASALQHLMGPRAAASIDLGKMNQDNHATAGLVGRLLAIDDDFAKGRRLPDGWLKKLSESKQITANPKYGQQFDFVSRATPMILSNHWPQTSDLSRGLTRRAQVFHFNSVITEEEMDHGLLNRVLAEESSGVLNRLLEGWARVQRRGRFDDPVDCLRAKRIWQGKRNSLSAFLEDCVEVTDDPVDRITLAEFWETFKFWCLDNNTENRWGKTAFYDEVVQVLGVDLVRPGNVKTLVGVRVCQEAETDPADDFLDLLGD